LDITRIEDKHTPHDAYELQERLEIVAKAVMSLPKMQRAAIMLRKYQELSYSEVASILECSESSARANVYQGLKKLRSKLTRKAMSKVMR
jgi:RNA polymerase sigma factor (sigma-70 family)